MNESVSEIIKDLSEAVLAIVTAICLIVKTKRDGKPEKPDEEWGEGVQPPFPLSLLFYRTHLKL